MDAVVTPHTLVVVDADVLTGGAPIVVLAPHPDDESLGCGALLAHAFAHDGAHVICMTDGSASHPGSREWPPARLAAARRRELARAIGHLGGTGVDMTWLGHPDGWLGAQNPDAVVASVAGICRRIEARHLFAPAADDHHEDHKSTARIALRVKKENPEITLFTYPLWSRWDDPEFAAAVARHDPVALDPGQWRAAKRAAITAHATQLGHIIHDDPTGFVMSRAFTDAFADSPEIYWRTPA
jgi:LmbE family N-acetylglucosaminyl deacetylase